MLSRMIGLRRLAVLCCFSALLYTADAWGTSSCRKHRQRTTRKSNLHISTSQSQEVEPVGLDGGYQYRYLERIGFSQEEARKLISDGPSLQQLQRLLSAHLLTVPFENMDQHEHPSHKETPLIPRRKNTPSLDVFRSLEKIVVRNRGGFCFELNFAFEWLLSSLGYQTRLALADVGCNQPVPGHVIILVDGLMNDDVPVLVDVGFGTPGVCDVLLPVECNNVAPREDSHGDLFRFQPDHDIERFDTALYRTRIKNPDVQEAMYRFRLADDMETDATEFQDGLDRVLTTSPTFTEKRICVLSDDRGHITLGEDYVKWVEAGESVRRLELATETAWRCALNQYFGITLTPEE